MYFDRTVTLRHLTYIAQGWIDTDGLKNLEYIYKAYHALGGNGTGTELYNRAKALPLRGDKQ